MLRNRVWNILQWFCYIPAHTRMWTFTLANHRVHEHAQLHEKGCFPMCGNQGSLTRILRDSHILLLFAIKTPQEPLQLLSSACNHIDKTGTNPNWLFCPTTQREADTKTTTDVMLSTKENKIQATVLHCTLHLDREKTYSKKSLSNPVFG